MPSKQKGDSQIKNIQERAPLEVSETNEVDESQNDLFYGLNEEVSMDKLPISIAPKWMEEYKDPVIFDENDVEQYSKSIFFSKNDNGLFINLLDRYDWNSVSEYFGDRTKIANQLTVESVNNGGDINFISYSKIPFSNQLSSIYKLVIQLAQSIKPQQNETNNSEQNENKNDDNDNIRYPWNLIYPQSEETGLPIKSENNLYFVKLFFCGEWRSILIDDNVPMFDDKFIFPTIADSNEVWPQLLAKAILKFLILSNRLNEELYVPLIVQLLTSFVPCTTNQIKILKNDNFWYKYVAQLDEPYKIKTVELDKIEDWTMITALNNFAINDDIIEIHKQCWVISNFDNDHYPPQIVQDLWTNENEKKFANDASIIISNESSDIDIILQINSLNKNLSDQVGLFMYDETKNLKNVVEIINMNHGFGTIVATIKPNKIYMVEVEGNISYSISLYSQSPNIRISSRFGDDKTWEMTDYKMINLDLECKQHPIAQTFILFNIHITTISEDCNILFHSTFNDDILASSLVVYCVNFDDQSMQYIPNLNLSKFNIKQNKNGYSLIAFSRPTQNIKNSTYQIKILYDGDIEHSMIDMQSSLDFKIDYVQNFAASLMKDEIITDNAAKFMFVEICFKAKDNYTGFGKIIEFIDKETETVVFKTSSTQSILYVPQIFIGDSKFWLSVKLDKDNPGSDQNKLYQDDSVQCIVRIISDAKIRLFPDNSLQLKFEEIKKLNI